MQGIGANVAVTGYSDIGEDDHRMRKTITLGGALLVGIILIVAQRTRQNGPPAPGGGPELGRPAPGFQLQDLAGQKVSLSDFKGKVVLLDFWATWCGPCRESMPMLENMQRQHPNDFTLLAVNLGDSADQVIPFVKRTNLQTRVLLDLDGEVGNAYQTISIPMQAVIDKQGVLRYTQMGLYNGWQEDLWAEIEKLR